MFIHSMHARTITFRWKNFHLHLVVLCRLAEKKAAHTHTQTKKRILDYMDINVNHVASSTSMCIWRTLPECNDSTRNVHINTAIHTHTYTHRQQQPQCKRMNGTNERAYESKSKNVERNIRTAEKKCSFETTDAKREKKRESCKSI